MEIKFLHSGSGGNCFVVITDSATIAIDIGLNKTQTEKKLMDSGVMPSDIDAIFLTHGHKDHCSGLPVAKKWNIPVYASEGTWKTVKYDGIAMVIREDDPLLIKLSLSIKAFKTHHDDYESFWYTITGDGFKVSVCLDTGHISPDMIEAMRGSTHYIIESNHDVDMTILDTSRPDSVKARNLSDIGHLSNEQTAEALCKLVTGNGEQIYLAHLSNKCNNPILAKHTVVMTLLSRHGFENGKHYKLRTV